MDCGLLIGAVVLTRFLFRSHYLYDIDSVNFALALHRFDPTLHQPQPPGYFLYICLGRLVNAVFQDANTAFVAISIGASGAAVALIYALTRDWFGRRPAVFAGLIFLFSPLCWFHGTVALTYIVEAFFSALAGYCCWRVYLGNTGWLIPASAVLGMAAGFRPSSLLLLGPMWLLSLSKVRMKQAFLACGALIVMLGGWLIPMLRECGGSSAYFTSLSALWLMVPSKQTVFNSPIFMSIARFCVVLGILGLGTGAAGIAVLKPGDPDRHLHREIRRFTWVWITPGLFFFTFVFLKSVNSGYLLVVLPPVFAWLGLWISEWYGKATLSGWKTATVTLGAAANAVIFLYAPLYCSYSAVRRFEVELTQITSTLPCIASLDETLIIGFDSHFLGYRHAAYYLPDYLTVQYPEVRLPRGLRVFAVEHRSTELLSSIPVRRFRNFVLFPLPRGPSEYQEYLNGVRARFRPGALRSTVVDGHEFVMGSVADLPALFPNIARVYTQLHGALEPVYSR
jgi:MFS family permease